MNTWTSVSAGSLKKIIKRRCLYSDRSYCLYRIHRSTHLLPEIFSTIYKHDPAIKTGTSIENHYAHFCNGLSSMALSRSTLVSMLTPCQKIRLKRKSPLKRKCSKSFSRQENIGLSFWPFTPLPRGWERLIDCGGKMSTLESASLLFGPERAMALIGRNRSR